MLKGLGDKKHKNGPEVGNLLATPGMETPMDNAPGGPLQRSKTSKQKSNKLAKEPALRKAGTKLDKN